MSFERVDLPEGESERYGDGDLDMDETSTGANVGNTVGNATSHREGTSIGIPAG